MFALVLVAMGQNINKHYHGMTKYTFPFTQKNNKIDIILNKNCQSHWTKDRESCKWRNIEAVFQVNVINSLNPVYLMKSSCVHGSEETAYGRWVATPKTHFGFWIKLLSSTYWLFGQYWSLLIWQTTSFIKPVTVTVPLKITFVTKLICNSEILSTPN